MSTALALAAVTHVLKTALNNSLVQQDLGGQFQVSTLPPDRIDVTEADPKNRLNLYLYRATSNQGWSSAGLPSRDAQGSRINTPPLVLDLHYLLTAYGNNDPLQGEMLLGCGMQFMHEYPVLGRDAIWQSLNSDSVSVASLPENLQALSHSELAEQVEQIKISPLPMTLDELSKLWTAFQAKYRPSAAYLVSAVLIETRKPKRSPLPVLSRGGADGESGHERGISVQASLALPFPSLERVIPPNQQDAVRVGETLMVKGSLLDGDGVTALLQSSRFQDTKEIPITSPSSASAFAFDIPDQASPHSSDPIDWPAGFYLLRARVERSRELPKTTNALPFVLAPTVVSLNAVRSSDGKVTVTVTCKPWVMPGQRASLVLGEQEFWSETRPDNENSLVFKAGHFPAGEFYCRLRIDGAESLLIDKTQSPPQFDGNQRVRIDP